MVHLFDAFLFLHSFVFRHRRFKMICSLEEELTKWEGIEFSRHHYGGMQINLSKKELGHIHGNGLLDVHVGSGNKEFCISTFHCENHHILEESASWVSLWIREKEDFSRALALLNFMYQKQIKP
ncbi:MAG: luciferase family protein [Flavobacteriales bacterium]